MSDDTWGEQDAERTLSEARDSKGFKVFNRGAVPTVRPDKLDADAIIPKTTFERLTADEQRVAEYFASLAGD